MKTPEEIIAIYRKGCGGLICTSERMASAGITSQDVDDAFAKLIKQKEEQAAQ